MKQLLIVQANGTTETELPDAVFVPLDLRAETRNNQDAFDYALGVITARRDCLIDVRASAESVGANDFRIFLQKNGTESVATGKGIALVSGDQRIQVSVQRKISLRKGETVAVSVAQFGVPLASLWLYPETVFIEVEDCGI